MEVAYKDTHAALVHACRQGSRTAQFDLYNLYGKAMYNVALRILVYEEEAEDVIQEAFLDAFTRIADFRQETTFGLWLKQIVINKSINYLRKRKMEFVDAPIENIPEEEVMDADEQEYQVAQVKRAMQELPDGYRVVVTLYLLEGYDHEEIAHALQIKESTSRTQYLRGKKKLQEILTLRGVGR